MTSTKVFLLKDADYDVAASVTPAHEDGTGALVTIMDGPRDQFITMRADDFARMAAAISNALD